MTQRIIDQNKEIEDSEKHLRAAFLKLPIVRGGISVQIAKECQKLLLSVSRPENRIPDEYEVGINYCRLEKG